MDNACPYCDYVFPAPVKRSRKCPLCKNKVKVVRQLHGYRLLTEDQHDVYQYEKERRGLKRKWLNYCARAGFYISEDNYSRNLRDEFEDPREPIYRVLVRFAMKAQEVHEYRKASVACFIIGRMLLGYDNERAFEHWKLKEQLELIRQRYSSNLMWMVNISTNGCCSFCSHLDGAVFHFQDCLDNPPIPIKNCEKGLCLAGYTYSAVRDQNDRPIRIRP